MKKSLMLITFVLIFLFAGPVIFSHAFNGNFQNNLKLGDSSGDVLVLQQILNSNPITAVALSGIGSAGQETTFFGSLTKNAVIKFQNLYSSTILASTGLSQGTGFVGQATRAELNKLLLSGKTATSTNNTNNNSPAIVSSSTSTSQNNQTILKASSVSVFSVSPYIVIPGGNAVINGYGFTSQKNTIYLSGNSIGDFVSTSSREIYFTVPSFLSEGSYEVRVANSNGDSKTGQQGTTLLKVRNTLPNPPQITSISPLVASTTDTITITGSNFSSDSNLIFSSFGSTTVPSADGTHLQFKLSSFSDLKLVTSRLLGDTTHPKHSMDVPIYVITSDGVNNGQIILKVNF